MKKTLSQSYRDVIRRDVYSQMYPKNIEKLKWSLGAIWLTLALIYVTFIHSQCKESVRHILSTYAFYKETSKPTVGFFIHLGAVCFSIICFFVLVLLLMGLSFWAFDMVQRNKVILEQSREP